VLTPEPNAQHIRAFPEQTRAPEQRSSFSVAAKVVTSSLKSPWGITHLADGRMLITEKAGNLVIVTPDGKISAPIQGVPAVDSGGQGGLLDVSLDPNFANNRWVYLTYSEPRDGGKNATSVGRAKLSADETRLEDWKIIFAQTPAWASNNHFGSRLVWDKNGFLYVTLGDRYTVESRVLAQDLKATLGKVIRIKSDGTVPADNPFVGNANALPEIWSIGHRNPQGAAIHPVTGELWTLEHGPKGGDEVNKPEAGKNYGWPIITYGEDYSGAPIGAGIASKAGMEQPIYYFDPVIAPGGINFYQGTLFTGWENNLLIGSLTPGGLVRLVFKDNKVVGEERVVKELGRVRDLDVAADGSIWVISDSGQLNRLTPKP
jgi:glucose/arabinose dehydrogenase